MFTARRFIPIIARALLLGALICVGGLAARAYHSEYLFNRAELGRKTISDYERLLAASWDENSYHSAAATRYAQLMQTRGRWAESRKVLNTSGVASSNWQAWELLGASWEHLAFTEAGTLNDAEHAAAYYDKILKVYPAYESGLERRGLLALKLGEWETVADTANRLIAIDSGNSNAIYLRARMAEGLGDFARARDAYSRLSAQPDSGRDALYTKAELTKALTLPMIGGQR